MNDPLIELASRLVAFDTVSANSNLVAAEWLATELEKRGMVVLVHGYEDERGMAKANVVARMGPPEPDGLLIAGHIDTVPFAEQPGWCCDPLRLTIIGDRLYGRGVADMKVFIAQCVHAAGRLAPGTLRRPLVFAFTADEEVGCLGAKRLVDSIEMLLGGTPLPRLAWIGEPTSYRLHHAHKSAVLFSIRVVGKSGHSGLPELGVNAIVVAGRIVSLLEEVDRELGTRGSRGDLFFDSPYATLNVGTIRGGDAPNVIAGECEIGVLYRSLPGDDPLQIHREILARLDRVDLCEHRSDRAGARLEVSVPVVVPPMETPRGTRLESVLRELTGRGEPTGSLLAADGCRFEALGVRTVICGPGEFDQAHQPNESLPLPELARGAQLVEKVIARLCS